MKNDQNIGFADFLTAKRKIKQEFFNQVNFIVDWRPISNIINEHYSKGTSVTGRPSYDGLILFKMTLLQTWYGLRYSPSFGRLLVQVKYCTIGQGGEKGIR